MAHQHRSIKFEKVDDGKDVIAEAIRRIPGGWTARFPEPSTGDAIDVIARSELHGESAQHRRRSAKAGEEHDGAPGPAPIHHFERDAFVYGNHQLWWASKRECLHGDLREHDTDEGQDVSTQQLVHRVP